MRKTRQSTEHRTFKFILSKIYPVIDCKINDLSYASQVEKLATAGAQLIQLRAGYLSPGEFRDECVRAISTAERIGVVVVINRNVDLAMATLARGVHLDQEDISPDMARTIMGEDAIIGVSARSAEQVIDASRGPADYISMGPIFGDAEEQIHPIGLEAIREVKRAISPSFLPRFGIVSSQGRVSLFAEGGIALDRVRSAIDAGADGVVVHCTKWHGDFSENARAFFDQVKVTRS